METKEKLLKYIEYKSISKRRFSKLCGLSNGFLDSGRSVGVDKVKIIIDTFPDLSADWLIFDKGKMIKSAEDIPEYSPVKAKYKSEPGKAVPFYDIDFAAGDIAFIDDNTIIPAYYMDIPEFAGCTAFRIYSDSMEKLIKSGSIVFGTKVSEWHEYIEYGQIYGIIVSDGRRFVKYIRKGKNQNNFTLKSENIDYDDFLVPKKDIRSLWLIHGWLNKRV